MTRRLWLVNLLLAVGCSTIGGLDLAVGHPMLAPLMFASAGVNGLVGAFNKRHNARPPEPAHRPDYAKIRRLELELGLRDPDPVPDPEPVVRVSRPGMAPNGKRCYRAGPGECYSDCGLMAWGVCPDRPKPSTALDQHERFKYQARPRVVPPAVTSASEWAYCPVCTRRHAGRCAG